METTLGEQLLLLSLDDESGAEQESAKVALAVSAATLVEPALTGRIDVTGDKVTVLDRAPLGEPALDAALAEIAGRDRPGGTGDWINRLKGDAVAGARRGLLDKRLVREERKKVPGLFPVRRYPEADGSAEAVVRRRLEEVVLGGGAPDDRTASLVALLHGAGLHRLAFPDADRAAVKKAMAAVAHGRWSAEAVRRVIEAAENALTVIVTTTVVTTTTMNG